MASRCTNRARWSRDTSGAASHRAPKRFNAHNLKIRAIHPTVGIKNGNLARAERPGDPAAGNDLARTLAQLKDAARSIRVLALALIFITASQCSSVTSSVFAAR